MVPVRDPKSIASLMLALLFLIPSALVAAPVAAQSTADFDVIDIAFAPVTLGANATTLSLSDNTVTAAISLGFTTTFFGETARDFWVGSNGFVTLHFLTPDGCCGGDPIPTPGGPDGMVAGLWTDLDPSAGGQVRFERVSLGGAPALVVDYDQVPVKGSLSETVSFQVHVMENGTIETHYARFHSPSGMDVTVGLENIDGSRGVEVLHETGTGNTSTEVALRFVPLDPPPVQGEGGYRVDEIPGGLLEGDPDEPVGLFNLGDDQVSGPVSLGFETPFFGVPTTEFQVSSNGFVYLAPGSDSGCCSGDPIPSSGSPDGIVAGHWTDLNPSDGGAITVQHATLDGVAAKIVEYSDVPFFGSTTETVTFQVVIVADGTLQIRYGAIANNTRTTTVGVENQDGTGGVEIFHGGGSESLSGRAFLLTPEQTSAYDVAETAHTPVNLSAEATTVALGDDFVTSAFPLGFQGTFFGDPTTEFWVGSNGFVTLHFLTPDGCCQGEPMPTVGGPDGMVAGYWTDLDPSAGGEVRFERFTTAAGGALVVDYAGIPVKGTNETVSFQFEFHENGTFALHYIDATILDGVVTTIGAENIDATDAVQLFHGDASTFTDNNTTSGDNNTTTEDNTTTLINSTGLSGRSFVFVPNFSVPEPPAPAPDIIELTPDDGPSGTLVEVTGTDFDPNATITFGGLAVDFVIDNGTTAHFIVPDGLQNGDFDVRLRNPDGQSDTSNFQLANPFSIQAIDPAEARQGDTVTILGGGFTSQTEALLDGRFVEIVGTTDGAVLDIRLPIDHTPGIYDVTLRDPIGGETTLVDGLTVRGRPDIAVASFTAERDDVQTPVTPDGTHAPGPWVLEATVANEGDLVGHDIEVRFLAGQTDGFGPLKGGEWELVDVRTIQALPTGASETFSVEWGSRTSLGDHQFRVETEVRGPVADRLAANDAAETEDYSLVGGLGGGDPNGCLIKVFHGCPEHTIRWEEHETTRRDQTDAHQAAQVRLDALMASPDFSFNNFDLVFTNTETFPDGSFEECTTWRFIDRADGTFRVTMRPDNGIEGEVAFSGGDASVLFGERVIERKTQLVLDTGVREVVLFETPTERFFRGPTPPAETYTFAASDPGTGDHFGWSAEFQDLSGDFTHCALRLASGGGNDTFTFAALPDDLDAHVASLDGAGTAGHTEITIEEVTHTVTERPVTDGV